MIMKLLIPILYILLQILGGQQSGVVLFFSPDCEHCHTVINSPVLQAWLDADEGRSILLVNVQSQAIHGHEAYQIAIGDTIKTPTLLAGDGTTFVGSDEILTAMSNDTVPLMDTGDWTGWVSFNTNFPDESGVLTSQNITNLSPDGLMCVVTTESLYSLICAIKRDLCKWLYCQIMRKRTSTQSTFVQSGWSKLKEM